MYIESLYNQRKYRFRSRMIWDNNIINQIGLHLAVVDEQGCTSTVYPPSGWPGRPARPGGSSCSWRGCLRPLWPPRSLYRTGLQPKMLQGCILFQQAVTNKVLFWGKYSYVS